MNRKISVTESREAQSLNEFVAVLAADDQLFETAYDINLRDAWQAVKKNSLVVCSDLFDKIDREDIIEIYDLTGRQLFRSFHALRYFSYTIEELTQYPFFQLFEREPEIDAAYADQFMRMVTGQIQTTVEIDIRAHEVRERLSERKLVSIVKPKILSPIKDRQGRLVAFFHTCAAVRCQ